MSKKSCDCGIYSPRWCDSKIQVTETRGKTYIRTLCKFTDGNQRLWEFARIAHCTTVRGSRICVCVFLFFIYFPVTRTKQQWHDTHKLEVQTAEPGEQSGFVEGDVPMQRQDCHKGAGAGWAPMAEWAQGTGRRQRPAVTPADSRWQQRAAPLSL